jgi:hypothetical protein
MCHILHPASIVRKDAVIIGSSNFRRLPAG